MTTIRIDLPWDKPPLSANERLHWAAKARITREVRLTACLLAKAAKAPKTDRLTVTLHWQPATKRRRDSVNLAPLLKVLVDGAVLDSGICPDDDTEHVSTPEPVIHQPGDKAALWLVLEYPPYEPSGMDEFTPHLTHNPEVQP